MKATAVKAIITTDVILTSYDADASGLESKKQKTKAEISIKNAFNS